MSKNVRFKKEKYTRKEVIDVLTRNDKFTLDEYNHFKGHHVEIYNGELYKFNQKATLKDYETLVVDMIRYFSGYDANNRIALISLVDYMDIWTFLYGVLHYNSSLFPIPSKDLTIYLVENNIIIAKEVE